MVILIVCGFFVVADGVSEHSDAGGRGGGCGCDCACYDGDGGHAVVVVLLLVVGVVRGVLVLCCC